MYTNHGLIMLDDKHPAGYLFIFQGRAFYPGGKLEGVTREQADEHNRLLSKAELLGLDQNCQVGQGGTFYLHGNTVTTWIGEVVDPTATIHGKSVTFTRGSKVFRGRTQKNADAFRFRRIR